MAKAPDDRYQSAGAGRRRVRRAGLGDRRPARPAPADAAGAQGGEGAKPPPAAGPRGRDGPRSPAAVAAVIALVAVLLPLGARRRRNTKAEAATPPGMALMSAKSWTPEGVHPGSPRWNKPVEAIYGDGSYWVLALDPPSIVQVDADHGEDRGPDPPGRSTSRLLRRRRRHRLVHLSHARQRDTIGLSLPNGGNPRSDHHRRGTNGLGWPAVVATSTLWVGSVDGYVYRGTCDDGSPVEDQPAIGPLRSSLRGDVRRGQRRVWVGAATASS